MLLDSKLRGCVERLVSVGHGRWRRARRRERTDSIEFVPSAGAAQLVELGVRIELAERVERGGGGRRLPATALLMSQAPRELGRVESRPRLTRESVRSVVRVHMARLASIRTERRAQVRSARNSGDHALV